MPPFRSSFTARLIAAATSLVLMGGGVISLAHIEPSRALPLLFLAAIAMGIVALVMGALDYPLQVVLLAILLPIALWPYVILLGWIVEAGTGYAWLLIVAGLLPPTLLALPAKPAPLGATS